jgi:hypothetical protein
MNNPSSLWAVCALVLGAVACGGSSLDGGSSQPDGGTSGSSGSSGSSGGDGTIPSTPITGTVNGAPFAPKSIEVQLQAGSWFMSIRSYESTCGKLGKGPNTGADLAVINIGGLAGKAGTESIFYADGHGASFQTGVYEKDKGEPVINTVTDGTLRFDTWSDTPGQTVTGALKLVGEGSEVKGTFTATVCPARG